MLETRWFLRPRIILAVGGGRMSMEEIRLNNLEIRGLLDAGQAPVHMIFDAATLLALPMNIREIRQNVDFLGHPNLGYIIAVGANPRVLVVATIVSSIFGVKVRQASSHEEAYLLLQQFDESLQA